MLWFHDSFSSLSLLYSYALSFTSRHSFYPPRLYEFDDHQHFIQRYDISAVFILSSSSILGRHWFLTRLNALVGLVQLCRHDFCLLNPAINLRSNITQATYDFVTQFPILLSSPISLFPPLLRLLHDTTHLFCIQGNLIRLLFSLFPFVFSRITHIHQA